MNLIGKIFVFAVFIMSLVLMTFATAIYISHTNWQDLVERPRDQVTAEKPLGLRYKLEEEKEKREELDRQITDLKAQIAASEAARDKVVAKLQVALGEKTQELDTLRVEKEMRQKDIQDLTMKLQEANQSLEQASQEAMKLKKEVDDQQNTVNQQVVRAADLAKQLAEQKAWLEIANERKAQLEKTVANARLLLQQSGLSVDSPPRDRVPKLDGTVLVVTAGMVQVSIGADDGLQVGHTLEVYRGDQYVGRVVVRAVRPDHAVAEPVREYMRDGIQREDRVTTRLKG
jgi:hypothetical protein